MTAYERTGWRDQHLSERHRLWGFNCPAVDLDFVMCEYNHGIPAAIVDYKKYTAQPVNIGHSTYKAIAALADAAKVPFIVAWYWPEEWWFLVQPINDAARIIYPDDPKYLRLTEQRFVKSLYYIRQRKLTEYDKSFIDSLNTIEPPAEMQMPKAA